MLNPSKNDAFDGYESLANAIVEVAARDYKRTLITLRRAPCRSAILQKRSLERFFRSSWYRTLTRVDAQYIIDRIKQEVTDNEVALE